MMGERLSSASRARFDQNGGLAGFSAVRGPLPLSWGIVAIPLSSRASLQAVSSGRKSPTRRKGFNKEAVKQYDTVSCIG